MNSELVFFGFLISFYIIHKRREFKILKFDQKRERENERLRTLTYIPLISPTPLYEWKKKSQVVRIETREKWMIIAVHTWQAENKRF